MNRAIVKKLNWIDGRPVVIVMRAIEERRSVFQLPVPLAHTAAFVARLLISTRPEVPAGEEREAAR